MDLSTKKIKKAIGIDHLSVNEFIGFRFCDEEEALKAVQDGNFEIVNHCDRSDVGDIYDNLKNGSYKAYPIQNSTYDYLIVFQYEYYLVEFQ
ncbi:hypothetical protein bcgnr5390_12830 [Bacillus luti]|nr:hypothetical protein BC2903_51510 [Bacillus cereus]